jgi:hypothetical protein
LYGELALLEANILYLYYEAPPVEQNMLMISELLRAGFNNESSDMNIETDLCRLFKMLEEKDTESYALKLWHDYINEYGDNNRYVCESLLKKMSSINVFYNYMDDEYSSFIFGLNDQETNDKEIFPDLTQENINYMSVSIVCNSDRGDSACPDFFNNIDEAQVLYIKLFLNYICNLPKEERIAQSKTLFNTSVENLISTTKLYATPVINDIIDQLKNYESIYNKVEEKNQSLYNFFNEYK